MNILQNDMTYGLLKNALGASQLRQETIANNIANINTPNYKASRVIFEEELQRVLQRGGSIGLKATHFNHIGISKQTVEPKIIKDTAASMRNDGNNVDIDLEMANLAANQLLYNALIQQSNGKISTLRYIIHEGRS
ncbi:flagellar basal body rod protein FlgB [Garciella nitratireducens]|uniref:Flagellar basal body rod protein FlgB n=1 Tax=Garciella nitratireducens DSM 15102 TaxID=1121911 RepID=A0A1T4LE50_9FIRM|nr:flagellar basal body rod protein FlgB [Garciella nitratireducens]SJZ53025.1 flagellar basal-body rod protein FlgB [Garciella nitratireducens DSM 15102]